MKMDRRMLILVTVLICAGALTIFLGYTATNSLVDKVHAMSTQAMPMQLSIARFLENVDNEFHTADDQRHCDSTAKLAANRRAFETSMSEILRGLRRFGMQSSPLPGQASGEFTELTSLAEVHVATKENLEQSRMELAKAEALALEATASVVDTMQRLHREKVSSMLDAWRANQACQSQLKTLLLHRQRISSIRDSVTRVHYETNRFKLAVVDDRVKSDFDTIRTLNVNGGSTADDILLLTKSLEESLLGPDGLLELKSAALRNPSDSGVRTQLEALEERIKDSLEAVRVLDVEAGDPLELQAVKQEDRIIAATSVASLASSVFEGATGVSEGVTAISTAMARLSNNALAADTAAARKNLAEKFASIRDFTVSMREALEKLQGDTILPQVQQARSAIDRMEVLLLDSRTGAIAAIDRSVAADKALNECYERTHATLAQLESVGEAQLNNAESRQVAEMTAADDIARSSRIVMILGSIIVLGTGIGLGLWARHSMTRTLKESDERFKQITNAISEVFWIVNLRTGKTEYISPGYEKVWRRDPRKLQENALDFLEAIHPDDRPRISKKLSGPGSAALDEEYRLVWPDGSVRWIWDRGFPIYDDKGNLIRAAGIAQDITERKRLEAERDEANKQLLVMSREAGKAEVATSVLHNVGNVLNSVNVSATVVREMVQHSKAGGLGKVTVLLREHSHDLGTYISSDEKGKLLPNYLCRLSEYLSDEQLSIMRELESLTRNIDHIKDIVSMQQTYAQNAGLVETTRADTLFEDAVRMNSGALERHRIQIVRDYVDNPKISVDRHKVLQILVNLIRNAKYALDESGSAEKRLTLRIENQGSNVRFSVKDLGVGIPPENLTRIFQRGFTTRKNGHGFGLHSAAIAAREMRGSLTAHSNGLGQGAEFILQLPLLNVEAAV